MLKTDKNIKYKALVTKQVWCDVLVDLVEGNIVEIDIPPQFIQSLISDNLIAKE